MRRAERPLVVATDSPAAVRDADHVLVTDGGIVVEDGAPADLLSTPGLYAQRYGEEIGANFSGPEKDVADE
jgi:ABC-type multidrug transport system fused ATPase/permease subunit